MKRRDSLKILAATAATPLLASLGCAEVEAPPSPATAPASKAPAKEPAARMPAIFLAHGSPQLVDDHDWVTMLADWARALPRPQAVLMVSAHWEAAPLTIGAEKTLPLVYDFYHFPERYYQTTYAAPGAPALAARLRDLLSRAAIVSKDDPERGWDHGAYVPLLCMYPKADVPVLQISMPSLDARELFRLGRTLAPLRDEGVLIVGSGFLTHNLYEGFTETTPEWAKAFAAWTHEAIATRDMDRLIDYKEKAPEVDMAHPTVEHFVPLLVAAGASADAAEAVRFPIDGFMGGSSFTRKSVQFG